MGIRAKLASCDTGRKQVILLGKVCTGNRCGQDSKVTKIMLQAFAGLVWLLTGDPFRSGCRTTPTTHHPDNSPPKAKRPATAKA